MNRIRVWKALPVLVLITILAGRILTASETAAALTKEQISDVGRLVRSTQDKVTLLQARLGERQRELGAAYSQYKIDAANSRRLQGDIIDLQRQLLDCHHQMHVELRKIVDEKQFERLRRRLEQMMTSPSKLHKTNESSVPKP